MPLARRLPWIVAALALLAVAPASLMARADEPAPAPRAAPRRAARSRVPRRRARVARPPGAIVPWPVPPALIIRQTPGAHDEVGDLLRQLRR